MTWSMRMGQGAYSIDMVDEDGPDEVALALVLLAEGGPLLLRILHQPLNEVGAALADHWGDGCIILHHQNTSAPVAVESH